MRARYTEIKNQFAASRERVSSALVDALAKTNVIGDERSADSDTGTSASASTSRASLFGKRERKLKTRIAIDDAYYVGDQVDDDAGGAVDNLVRFVDDSVSLGANVGAAPRALITITRGTQMSFAENKSVFIVARIVRGDGTLKGRRIVTTSRSKTREPVWNATRDFACAVDDDDMLCVDAYQGSSVRGIDRATLIARGQITMRALTRAGNAEVAVRLRGKLELDGERFGACMVRSDRALDVALKTTKRVFFVRHGESKWNEAQRDINIANMMRFDHPLTLVGVQQAQALGSRAAVACSHARQGVLVHANISDLSPPTMSPPSGPSSPMSQRAMSDMEKSAGEALCSSYESCTTCYVSPLTRAVQTACFLLHSHPNATGSTMRQVCLQSIREIKGVGGLDTVGIAQGDGVIARAQQKVAELINAHSASQLLSRGVTFDANDAVGQWWTSETDSDSTQEVEERIVDFLETIRFDASGDAVIVVGHSLFLQQFVSRVAPELAVSQDGVVGVTSAQAIPQPAANPFDDIPGINPFAQPAVDPFAVPPKPNDFDALFATNASKSSGADDIAFTPFVPSVAPVMARIDERRDKKKIFEKLMNAKLCNAGCVALDLEFDERGRATLVDASLAFGSKFV